MSGPLRSVFDPQKVVGDISDLQQVVGVTGNSSLQQQIQETKQTLVDNLNSVETNLLRTVETSSAQTNQTILNALSNVVEDLEAKSLKDKLERTLLDLGPDRGSLSLGEFYYEDGNKIINETFNDTEKDELQWSASVSKSILGILIGVLELKYPQFKSSTTIVKHNLPPGFDYVGTVLDSDTLTLQDVVSMNAGIIQDGVTSDLMGSTLEEHPLAQLLPNYFLVGYGSACNAEGNSNFPSYFNGSLLKNLQKVLKNKSGQPIQMQNNNPLNQISIQNSKVGIYDPINPEPNFPVYSTASIELGGLIFQVVLGRLAFNKVNNELATMLETEGWCREHLFSKLGHPEIRLLSDAVGEVWMAGSSTLINTSFLVELMRLLLSGDGKYKGVQIIAQEYAEDLLKSTTGFNIDDSGASYTNGIWKGHKYQQSVLEFRGLGGVFVIGVHTHMTVAKRNTILVAVRKSGKTPSAKALQTDLTKVCARIISPFDFLNIMRINSKLGGEKDESFESFTDSIEWAIWGVPLEGSPFFPLGAETALVYASML